MRVAGGLLVLGVVLAVAGCGSTQHPDALRSTPPVSSPGSSPATPTGGNGSLVPTNLPDLPMVSSVPKPSPSGSPEELFGADISWPQCPKGMGIPEKRSQGAPMPTDEAQFVIVGLTNGPSFTPNPCLADQVRWVTDRHLLAAAYSVVSYPSAKTLRQYGSLSNVGYQAARFNLRTMRAAHLETPIIWIDVEPVPKFAWSADVAANAAVVQGMARGYTDAGFKIGFYSTPSLWRRVVGDLRVGGPEWRAAGQTSKAEALSRCGPDWSIQGGDALLGQWVEDGRDRNVTCPGAMTAVAFHQY